MSNYNDYLELHELYHHGIIGQKWGVRRFQNEDGSLTEAGQRKYYKNQDAAARTAFGAAGAATGIIGGVFLGRKLSRKAMDEAREKAMFFAEKRARGLAAEAGEKAIKEASEKAGKKLAAKEAQKIGREASQNAFNEAMIKSRSSISRQADNVAKSRFVKTVAGLAIAGLVAGLTINAVRKKLAERRRKNEQLVSSQSSAK